MNSQHLKQNFFIHTPNSFRKQAFPFRKEPNSIQTAKNDFRTIPAVKSTKPLHFTIIPNSISEGNFLNKTGLQTLKNLHAIFMLTLYIVQKIIYSHQMEKQEILKLHKEAEHLKKLAWHHFRMSKASKLFKQELLQAAREASQKCRAIREQIRKEFN